MSNKRLNDIEKSLELIHRITLIIEWLRTLTAFYAKICSIRINCISGIQWSTKNRSRIRPAWKRMDFLGEMNAEATLLHL